MIQYATSPGEADQVAKVQRHFEAVSREWGERYNGRPRRMSDLDLQLRRANCHELLRSVAARSNSLPLRLVDLGCGAGNLLEGLNEAEFTPVGVDLVPEMVAVAARRHPQLEFVAADITALPFPDGHADVVTCLGVLEYVGEPAGALGEIRRVLQSGGDLIVSFPNRRSLLRRMSQLAADAETGVRRLARRCRGEGQNNGDCTPYAHRQWTPNEMHTLLRDAGFSIRRMLFNTYGAWGRFGRTTASIELSRWLSTAFREKSMVSTAFAYTTVVHASPM